MFASELHRIKNTSMDRHSHNRYSHTSIRENPRVFYFGLGVFAQQIRQNVHEQDELNIMMILITRYVLVK